MENKVFIAVPNTGNIRTELAQWLFTQSGHQIFLSQARPIANNRNIIVKEFLASDCDWLLMVDSDVVPPLDVLDMVKNEVAVCSAHVSTIRGGELIPVGMTKNESGYHHDFKHSASELHKVDAVGTGCILIRRDVFDKLDKPYFKFVYNDEGELVNGEDFDFSERVSEVYFDGRYKCKHFVKLGI